MSRRTRFPDYLWIITNVPLSAADPGGGIDTLRSSVEAWLEHNYGTNDEPQTLASRGLRGVKVWHRNRLNIRIANNDSLRKRFGPLLTPGDILARIGRLPGLIPTDEIPKVMVDHAQVALARGRWVRFDDAGDVTNSRSVERAIVDLPARGHDDERGWIARWVLARGDQVLRESQWRPTQTDQAASPRHIVITGAPGNGKTTLMRYLTQVYRAAFARNDANEPAIQDLIASTDESLDRLGATPPNNPRWPLRIDLAAMGTVMGPDEGGPSIGRYLCDHINQASAVPVHPGTLYDWLKAWPAALFFDGLDEVTDPRTRQRVLNEITDLIATADSTDADLLVVITTRPTGYTPLIPEQFDQIDLDYFTTDEARDYGRHITTERLAHDDIEYRNQVLTKFDEAVATAAVERLLKTPLQVLILTLIVAHSGPLPANRYELFWTYYETIFKREAGKPTTYRDFFNHHGPEITVLHKRVGIVLHRLCEATREIRGRLGLEELKGIARDRMIELGHDIPSANGLAATMVKIATHRLVLLAADDDETVSFDVRSLQELMAGCALVDVPDTDVRTNLITAACSPHWRNAWLFAAGRLFTGADHQRALVLDVVEQCDKQGHWHGWLYPAGPELAADILEDGLAADRPNDRRRLIQVALRVLNGPMPLDPKTFAHQLAAATDTGGRTQGLSVATTNDDRRYIRDALRQAFTADPAAYEIAAALLHYGSFGAHIPGQPDDPRHYADLWQYREPTGDPVKVGALLLHTLQNREPQGYLPPRLVADALQACDQLEMRRTDKGTLRLGRIPKVFHSEKLHAALEDPESEFELQLIMESLPASDWTAASAIARVYWPVASRWLIADRLHVLGD